MSAKVKKDLPSSVPNESNADTQPATPKKISVRNNKTSTPNVPPPNLPPELDGIVDNLKNEPLAPYKKPSRWKTPLIVAGVILALVGVGVLVFLWYQMNLRAVQPGSDELVEVEITPGTSSQQIAEELADKELIRSERAFYWYVRLTGSAGQLKSGTYRLSKGDDVPTIVGHLKDGKTDTFRLTFLPGDTLANHRKVLLDAGYSAADVDAALTKHYNHPLLAGKPAKADLEGYIYGETYEFAADATPETIITTTFDEFYDYLQQNQLIKQFAKHDLTLFKAITLASIIQREVSGKSDERQVAQVFFLRLKTGMQLGSDVTYQYIADKTGQPRDPNLDSPYNTRRYAGLPPGPIASPGAGALAAVANPAPGDYLYFLSGDDDKTYFARTAEGHEQNIRDHCQKKCQIL